MDAIDLHEADLDFMAEVREASRLKLEIFLRHQSAEAWRRAHILREIARRTGRPLPTTA